MWVEKNLPRRVLILQHETWKKPPMRMLKFDVKVTFEINGIGIAICNLDHDIGSYVRDNSILFQPIIQVHEEETLNL